ncbi:hypothetical protein [Streptomyces celluloflavus]|uniref:hypothetical protein n=1 Tax=Streptomyces celluloflavus TaxID=58344 RepID=UPI00368E01DD
MTEAANAPTIPAQTGAADEQAAPIAQLGHGGRIITALEAAWGTIRQRHRDVPRVVMITGTARQSGGRRWGHFGADFWAVPQEGSRASELFIAGELIALGGRPVLQVLLHEGAHGIAYARKIKDRSGDGKRYHNRKFVALAEEMGLKGPSAPIKTHGWTNCSLPDETAERYADVIAELDAAALPYLGASPAPSAGEDDEHQGDDADGEGDDGAREEPEKKRRAGKRFAVECECETPRRLQISPKSFEDGPLICGVCAKRFEPVGQDEGEDE